MASEREKSPKSADQQDAPEPERPVPDEELRREATPQDKPSQAEGSRDDAEQ